MMTTAEQWQEGLLGETSVQSIRLIQRDVLTHALVRIAALPKESETSDAFDVLAADLDELTSQT